MNAGQASTAPARMKLALGLGCDRGTPAATIAHAIDQALARVGASRADVVAAASINLKADEAGLLEVAAGAGGRCTSIPANTGSRHRPQPIRNRP